MEAVWLVWISLLSGASSPSGREERGERQTHRQQCRDERAEGEEQDHERDGQRQHLGAVQVAAERGGKGLVGARVAELLDAQPRMRLLGAGDRGEYRLDTGIRRVAVALTENWMRAERPSLVVARRPPAAVERRAHVLDQAGAIELGDRGVDGVPERGTSRP